jgi:hypothetical protein
MSTQSPCYELYPFDDLYLSHRLSLVIRYNHSFSVLRPYKYATFDTYAFVLVAPLFTLLLLSAPPD